MTTLRGVRTMTTRMVEKRTKKEYSRSRKMIGKTLSTCIAHANPSCQTPEENLPRVRINPFTATMSHENDQEKCEIEACQSFVFFFALACERSFIKTSRIESRRVKGPQNVLFVGASVHLSDRKFYRLGQ